MTFKEWSEYERTVREWREKRRRLMDGRIDGRKFKAAGTIGHDRTPLPWQGSVMLSWL